MSDLTSKSALELNSIFINKQASAEEITKAFISRIEKLDKNLNAFISIDTDDAIKRAKIVDQKLQSGSNMGKLAGVPVGIKDLINYEGAETTAGSKILVGHKSVYNATITDKIIEADAIPLGKLNLDEFAMGSSNETSAFGNCKNPWNLNCVPGGSSGGSAAAVAAQMLPLAFGTDTGGSIRQPAAYCGITGLKPTYGRVSRYGIVAFASSLDQAGPMTRGVEDNALFLEAMSGHDPKDSTSLNIAVPTYLEDLQEGFKKTQSLKGLRIGIAPEFFTDSLNADVKASVENAIKQFINLGAEIVDISLNKIKYGLPTYYIIAPCEASSNLARYDGVRYGYRDAGAKSLSELYPNSRSQFGAEVKRRIMLGVYALSSGYYDAYYKKAQQVRRLIFDDFQTAFSKCDLILSPTTPGTAFEFGSKSADPLEMYLSDIMTVTVNLAGLPGISIPCGFDTKGLPIGLQLIAPALQESLLYNASYAFQSTTDFLKTPNCAELAQALAK
jgi:aspartyl-tRNA(Asn)/glutamyl-tRNA(Gln) amidotransferase subunit A